MNNGYIYLWRKITESSFYTKPNCCHLAIHLLLKVNHTDRKMIFNNEEMIIKRGQVITGRKKLALETGLTEREIRTCLNILKKVGFLTIKATNKFSLIQVQKYEDYQKTDQHIDQQATSKRPASDHKQVIISNDNKEYISRFLEEFNKQFKKKYRGTKETQKLLNERLKNFSLEEIFTAIAKISQVPFYRGEGEGSRGWEASPDWFLKSDSRIDEWLNKKITIKKEDPLKVEYLEDIIAAESTPEQWEETARKAGIVP